MSKTVQLYRRAGEIAAGKLRRMMKLATVCMKTNEVLYEQSSEQTRNKQNKQDSQDSLSLTSTIN
jgi:hypothetical protein